jgi:hypothetical protein
MHRKNSPGGSATPGSETTPAGLASPFRNRGLAEKRRILTEAADRIETSLMNSYQWSVFSCQ